MRHRRLHRHPVAKALLILAVVALVFAAFAYRPSLDPVQPPAAGTVDAALVARGATIAALGDCRTCHTAADGKTFAGGRPLATPFGVIHGTNITPDPQTGIGTWSEAAFVRAMRDGVDREGRHLYPAFPYDHFRRATDDDLHALYAYIITRAPVISRPPPNALHFPLNIRPLVAGWKVLYLDRQRVPADAARGEEWNRGAYLATAIGHCGACHTPRNGLGAESQERAFEGGDAEGWQATPLTAANPAPVPWTLDELTVYLRGGVPLRHAVATGPMAEVAANLGGAPDADVRAIAVYVMSLLGEAPAQRKADAAALLARVDAEALAPAAPTAAASTASADVSATFYAGSCATCHDEGRRGAFAGAVPLALSTALSEATPRNALQVLLRGIAPPAGRPGAMMPSFDGALTDAQMELLAQYLRARFTTMPPWRDVTGVLNDIRRNPGG